MKTIYETDFSGLTLFKRGKVRDIYDLEEHLLLVATDRISAFDCVFPDPIPGKGIVLTQISRHWFDKTQNIIDNHIVSFEVDEFPSETEPYKDQLRDRSMLVKKTNPIPVECVVRGYLHGSATREYKKTQSVCGIELTEGLREKDPLPRPIFTPATKAESGHDENITFGRMCELIGADKAVFLRDTAKELYLMGHKELLSKGIILVDTKFEFGILDDEIILIDECMTPDSSRIYVEESYRPGVKSDNYDKQFLRDYLESTEWDKTPPAPKLPEEIIQGTAKRYHQALKVITGKELEE